MNITKLHEAITLKKKERSTYRLNNLENFKKEWLEVLETALKNWANTASYSYEKKDLLLQEDCYEDYNVLLNNFLSEKSNEIFILSGKFNKSSKDKIDLKLNIKIRDETKYNEYQEKQEIKEKELQIEQQIIKEKQNKLNKYLELMKQKFEEEELKKEKEEELMKEKKESKIWADIRKRQEEQLKKELEELKKKGLEKAKQEELKDEYEIVKRETEFEFSIDEFSISTLANEISKYGEILQIATDKILPTDKEINGTAFLIKMSIGDGNQAQLYMDGKYKFDDKFLRLLTRTISTDCIMTLAAFLSESAPFKI